MREAVGKPAGSPAARIAAPTASMSYATRSQVAVPAVEVEDQVAGARVAVARLADAARVEQRPALAERDRVARPAARACASGRRPREGDRHVGVAVQAVLGGDRGQRRRGRAPPT